MIQRGLWACHHWVNMLDGSFVSNVVMVEGRVQSLRVGAWWEVVISLRVLPWKELKDFSWGSGCSWEHIVTEEQAWPFPRWLWLSDVIGSVLYVFLPWGPYLSWLNGWHCALEPPDLCAKHSSFLWIPNYMYFIVVTEKYSTFFLLVLFSVDFIFDNSFVHPLTFFPSALLSGNL